MKLLKLIIIYTNLDACMFDQNECFKFVLYRVISYYIVLKYSVSYYFIFFVLCRVISKNIRERHNTVIIRHV
jgi:hypothetical protein